jgi:hypothetical protein
MKIPHTLIRNVHLVGSPFIGAFVYSGALRANDAFAALVQWGVFPLMAAGGLVLWLSPYLARRARARRAGE